MLKKIIKYIFSFRPTLYLFIATVVFNYMGTKTGEAAGYFAELGILTGILFMIIVPPALNEFLANNTKKVGWLIVLLASIILAAVMTLLPDSVFTFVTMPLLALFFGFIIFLFYPLFSLVLWLFNKIPFKKIPLKKIEKALTYENISLEYNNFMEMIKKIFKNITPNLLFIGVIILLSTIIWSNAFSKKEIKTYKNAVSVIGVSTKDVVSDKAIWVITISRKSLDRAKNIKELTVDEKLVREHIINLGFDKQILGSSRIGVDTIYKAKESGYGNTTEVENYETKSTFTIETKDVYKVGEGVNKLRLYCEEKGIGLIDNRAEYTYTNYESEKIPLLKIAISDAQDRANALVNASSGVSKTSIGKILSAQQGVFQVNSKNDKDVDDYGNFDTTSIEKTIRATVRVDFNAE